MQSMSERHEFTMSWRGGGFGVFGFFWRQGVWIFGGGAGFLWSFLLVWFGLVWFWFWYCCWVFLVDVVLFCFKFEGFFSFFYFLHCHFIFKTLSQCPECLPGVMHQGSAWNGFHYKRHSRFIKHWTKIPLIGANSRREKSIVWVLFQPFQMDWWAKFTTSFVP